MKTTKKRQTVAKKVEKSTKDTALSVKIFTTTFNSTGKDFEDAVNALPKINGKGASIWTFNDGDKSVSKVIQPSLTARFFASHGLVRSVLLSQIRNLMGA